MRASWEHKQTARWTLSPWLCGVAFGPPHPVTILLPPELHLQLHSLHPLLLQLLLHSLHVCGELCLLLVVLLWRTQTGTCRAMWVPPVPPPRACESEFGAVRRSSCSPRCRAAWPASPGPSVPSPLSGPGCSRPAAGWAGPPAGEPGAAPSEPDPSGWPWSSCCSSERPRHARCCSDAPAGCASLSGLPHPPPVHKKKTKKRICQLYTVKFFFFFTTSGDVLKIRNWTRCCFKGPIS